MRGSGLFTKEFILSIGGEDDPEMEEMIRVLNLLTGLWGEEATGHMQKFLNIVKSRTDELSLRMTTSEKGSGIVETLKPVGSSVASKKAPDNIKTQAKEIDKLKQEAVAMEKKYQDLEKKHSELKATKQDTDTEKLKLIIASYNKKCREMDSNRDETSRHFVWFNEQLLIHSTVKSEFERQISAKTKEIEELKRQLVNDSLKVFFIWFTKHKNKDTFSKQIYTICVLQETLHIDLIKKDFQEQLQRKGRGSESSFQVSTIFFFYKPKQTLT